MITFSCGCTFDSLDDGVEISHKDYARDGSRAVGYSFVCHNCIKNYDILNTEEEIDLWMQ